MQYYPIMILYIFIKKGICNMKKIIAVLISFSFLLSCGCSVVDKQGDIPPETEIPPAETTVTEENTMENENNLVINGDFSSGAVEPWGVFLNAARAAKNVKDNELCLNVINYGGTEYAVQLYQDAIPLYKNGVYRCTFDMRASEARKFEFRLQLNGGDYHAYVSEWIDITTEMTTYTVEFTMTEESDEFARLVYNCGYPNDGSRLGEHQIYLDNVCVELIDDSAVDKSQMKVPTDIAVNQIGYKPSQAKIAVFSGDNIGTTFEVIEVETGEVAYKGIIGEVRDNPVSGEKNAKGDFSELTKPGRYYIRLEGCDDSYQFEIGEAINGKLFFDTVSMFTLQRCGCELSEEYAGTHAHPACHTSEATIYGTSEKIDVSGGWHDAGDYGKYVVAGAKSVADLLLAYDINPMAFDDGMGIPESYNGMPDILDEVRYELDWMMKMQAPNGGVYHKVTTKDFPGDIMPEDDTAELIVTPISTTATADFAAVMAMAAKTYRTVDEAYAEKCLDCAEDAWAFLEANPNIIFNNPSDIATGAYDDNDDSDERYWAAAALYRATGDLKYLETIRNFDVKNKAQDLGWQNVAAYGSYLFISTENADKADHDLWNDIQVKFTADADYFCTTAENDGYMCANGSEYYWGSNMTVANRAMFMILANTVHPNEKYITVATEQLNYLCGRNPMDTCYITGSGTVSPKNPHHRPSAVNGTMKGMLVGGPNMNLEDEFAANKLRGEAPQKCYVDSHSSYSTNEITIYWNSPLVFVLGTIG